MRRAHAGDADSMVVFGVIESLRPPVDRLLDLLERRMFAKREVFDTRRGRADGRPVMG